MTEPLRILSLAGGGIRGILQTVLLERLESDLGSPLNQHFDLIAGTSTGGIAALAVAHGMPIREVSSLYKHHGPRIFAPRLGAAVRPGPRYHQKPLADALRTAFGNARLGDLGVETVITGSSLETFSGQTFSSSRDPDMSLLDAALATSAAPTYFPAVTPANSQRSYMDGGLWANDPSLVAVLHAQEKMGATLEAVRLFAVGTGKQPGGATLREVNTRRTASFGTVRFLLEFLMSAQSSFSEMYTDLLLPLGAYMQVNPQLAAPMALDDVGNALQRLPALAEQHYNRHRERILEFVTHGDGQPTARRKAEPHRRRKGPVVYWCGPHQERSNYDMKVALEEVGIHVKLPDELASDLSPSLTSADWAASVQRICREAIEESEIVVVSLATYGLDSAWEMGYAEAHGKVIVGYDASQDLLRVPRKVNKRLYRDNLMHGWENAYTSASLNEIARRCAAKVVYLFCPYKNEDAIRLVENSEVTKFAKDLIVSNNRLGLDPANPQAYSREARQRAVQFLRQADVILAVLPRYGMDTAWKLGYAAALGKELVGWITTEFGEESSEADYLDHWMHGWRKKPVMSTVTDLRRFIRGV